MRNLKITSTLLMVCFCAYSYSQPATDNNATSDKAEAGKINEAVLSLSYANGGMNFGLLYKRQVAEKRFFRMSLADIRFNRQKDSPRYSNQFATSRENFAANLNFGVEWRFSVHEKIQLYTGIDVVAGATHYANRVYNPSPGLERNQVFELTAGLAFNSGIIVQVHELVRIGLNLSPDVLYTWRPWDYYNDMGERVKGNSNGVNTSIGTGTVQAHVIFHWQGKGKKK